MRGIGFILLVAVAVPVWTPATTAGQLPNCTINFDDTCPDVSPECGATFSGGDGCNVIGEANCYSTGAFSYQVAQGGGLTITLSDDLNSVSVFFAHQVIDVVTQYPAVVDAETFAGSLRRLSPRSYSIASSQSANPDEVHLTVAAVRYEAFGSVHWGAASTHLADRVDEGKVVSVYVEENTRFRLPADDKPIIMIGPGTGVAPFRAFIEERAERGAVQAIALGRASTNDAHCRSNHFVLLVIAPIVEHFVRPSPVHPARPRGERGAGWHVDQLPVLPFKIAVEDFCHDASLTVFTERSRGPTSYPMTYRGERAGSQRSSPH